MIKLDTPLKQAGGIICIFIALILSSYWIIHSAFFLSFGSLDKFWSPFHIMIFVMAIVFLIPSVVILKVKSYPGV